MKAAGAFNGRPRELRTRHNMVQNIGLKKKGCHGSRMTAQSTPTGAVAIWNARRCRV